MQQAARAEPDNLEAWAHLGIAYSKLGQDAKALPAFERSIALGGDGPLNRFFIAGVRGGAPVPRPPDAYVRGLFDDYAADFDSHLVDKLRYTGHERVAGLLRRSGRRYRAVLDLGCGTRASRAAARTGGGRPDRRRRPVAAMLERARGRGLYTRLEAGDLVDFLRRTDERYDAVAVADVFIYVGALDAVFSGFRRVLDPGGIFAFSVDRADDALDFVLLPSLRYAHGECGHEHHGLRGAELSLKTFETPQLQQFSKQPPQS